MSTFEEARLHNRKQRRSSAIAVTKETTHLLECIQFTVQVNEDIAQLHDLLTQLGSLKDSLQVRKEIERTVRHCLEAAKSAKDRFLYIMINCRENVKLQNQAGQHMGIFGFCLTYMQGELKKCLQLISTFPMKEANLSQKSIEEDMTELDEILIGVEKHIHYIRPSAEADTTPELFRSKSDRATPSARSVERAATVSSTSGTTSSVTTSQLHASTANGNSGTVVVVAPPPGANNPFCSGLLCMPKKFA
ncbi:hypothetical protein BV898_16306 [Hypsibius exemplaris]|uniref:Uncharacterized protein n=1 Tax=Hypsibius exemplaris TaxID=2072580 RepID=A0A9X6RL53_HYPEX|nr:hypothetical protein BV898_16306 [Hypsibius exemplaris]